jgi:GNAT superfamily N-acetyltransferase
MFCKGSAGSSVLKSKHIPMSVKEFELMSHPFGWKAEYFDGEAHFTPRELIVRTKLTVTNQENAHIRPANVSGLMVPVEPSFKERAIDVFVETFEDSVEFCDWSLAAFHAHARKNINNYFQGIRGTPHPASRMFLEPDSQSIIGLALFVEKEKESTRERVELDLLLVKPSHQRMGIATEMVARAIDSLEAEGVKVIQSGYHICNHGSRDWHRGFGFEEVPNFLYCRLKVGWYRHEIWRREDLGESEQLEELRLELERWQQLSQEIEPWE